MYSKANYWLYHTHRHRFTRSDKINAAAIKKTRNSFRSKNQWKHSQTGRKKRIPSDGNWRWCVAIWMRKWNHKDHCNCCYQKIIQHNNHHHSSLSLILQSEMLRIAGFFFSFHLLLFSLYSTTWCKLAHERNAAFVFDNSDNGDDNSDRKEMDVDGKRRITN